LPKNKKKNVKLPEVTLFEYKFDLLKMEYEKCVETYQDIYHSIWKIFSYYSAITAAFLISSREFFPSFELPLLVLIGSFPLCFWWVGIYSPMNRYGEGKINRLIEIEKELRLLITELDSRVACHFEDFRRLKPNKSIWYMIKCKSGIKKWPPKTWFNIFNPSKYMRVKFAADLMGSLLSIILIVLLILFVIGWINKDLSLFIDP